jgi:2-dehydropantoate 2-reductase
MNILVVGAGAVGQVYARHLAQAGHRISFFVKAKYTDDLRSGLVLYQLGHGGSRRQTLSGFGIVTEPAAVAAARWDQIWLTLSSDALRGELAAGLLAAVGGATVICLQPDIGDGDYVRQRVAPGQVVQGLIPFLSYQSPLPGQSGPEGIAYFLPPLTPTVLGGDPARVQPVLQALRAGGLAARAVPDFARATGTAPAMLQPLIAALEVNGWQLGSLPGSAALRLGLAAAGEAGAIAAAETGASTLALRPLLSPHAWRLLLPLARRFFPLDLEAYLHYHFAKVGVQTRLMLESYIRLGDTRGLPAAALRELLQALPAVH